MGLLSEVLKLSPWHIQWGGAERNAFLYRFVYLHITSDWGGAHTISQSCVCMCIPACVCGGKVDSTTTISQLIDYLIERKLVFFKQKNFKHLLFPAF